MTGMGSSICRKCGENVSNDALTCPHCEGRPWPIPDLPHPSQSSRFEVVDGDAPWGALYSRKDRDMTNSTERAEVAMSRLLLSATNVDRDVRNEADDAVKAIITLDAELCEQVAALISFIGIQFGRGPDCIIPEEVGTPLGVPVKIGAIVREAQAVLARAKS